MNITDIKPFVMWAEGSGRNWMFVKVETDEGIHGWGEGGLVNQATTIAEAVHMLAPQIVGWSAFDIERAWQPHVPPQPVQERRNHQLGA